MNKDLFNLLEQTKIELDGQLDDESKKYLDKHIIERKLDGSNFIKFKNTLK